MSLAKRSVWGYVGEAHVLFVWLFVFEKVFLFVVGSTHFLSTVNVTFQNPTYVYQKTDETSQDDPTS